MLLFLRSTSRDILVFTSSLVPDCLINLLPWGKFFGASVGVVYPLSNGLLGSGHRGGHLELVRAGQRGSRAPETPPKSNPCQGVKVTVPKGRRDRWLTDSEIETLLQTLPEMKNQKAADVYLLILASLCRPGEAAAICRVRSRKS
jgi:hypothetical protein